LAQAILAQEGLPFCHLIACSLALLYSDG